MLIQLIKLASTEITGGQKGNGVRGEQREDDEEESFYILSRALNSSVRFLSQNKANKLLVFQR